MELLQQYFDTAFAAPDGIPKLRELILKLAMQGKLVPQDPNDSPASELIRTIEAEKKRLVKERKIKAPKTLPEVTASDEPYSLPHGWQWVRLGAIGNIFNGNSINASEKESKYAGVEGLPYIATKDVGYGFDPLDYDNGICIPPDEEKFRIAHQGAVLICAEGGSAGKKCGLTDRDICFGNKLFANELYGQIPSRFILYVYLSPAFRASFTAAMTGIIGGVSIAKFVEIPIPLPPLDEQHRIVAQIDRLMARCDALENLRNEREKKRLATHAAAIQQLLATADASAWDFIQQHFGELHTVKANVTELRKAILQLAVMGRLVPQDPNDPPASELLEEIGAERLRLVKAGKIKMPRPLPPTKPEEVPYQLPQGWEWVRVAELTDVGTGSTPATTNQDYYGGSIPWYTSSATNDLFASMPDKFITEKAISETNCKVFPAGSLMIAMYGQGKTRGQVSEIVIPGATNQAVAALVFFRSSEGIKKYLKYFFIKIYDEIRLLAEGAAQPNLNVGKIKETLVPLPPLSEQHRIVSRIDQLMALCDTVDQKINDATDKQTELLRAVMAQV